MLSKAQAGDMLHEAGHYLQRAASIQSSSKKRTVRHLDTQLKITRKRDKRSGGASPTTAAAAGGAAEESKDEGDGVNLVAMR